MLRSGGYASGGGIYGEFGRLRSAGGGDMVCGDRSLALHR
jgi:hypothetical protein